MTGRIRRQRATGAMFEIDPISRLPLNFRLVVDVYRICVLM
jgi:hypothetical protein